MTAPSSPRSRLSSLRAPIANEEERARFQRRLGLAAITMFLLSGLFFVISNVAVAVASPAIFWSTQLSRPSVIHLGGTLALLAVHLFLRQGTHSHRKLDVLDAGLAIGICATWAVMVQGRIPLSERPETIALIASIYTLVVRAALLPSTPLRTGLITGVALLPLVPVTLSLYATNESAPNVDSPLPRTVYVVTWSVLAIACTVVISKVIYGLQLQVRKAMQLGQYLLEEKIGEGGMGVVYRASHAMLRRPTAIKLLSGTNAQAAERFEREVQITARLTHPNTVAVFDYGRTPDGIFYYAMELIDGISLEELVRAHGAPPVERVVHILAQVCGALEEAHAAGLVHRDIKPANIMLTERGGVPDVVKVLDFGLVKELQRGEGLAASPHMSAANLILGTPNYMAPEAIVDPGKVDARTDLYAVGATAYFLLTGEHVFEGTNIVEICSKHLHEQPAAPSSIRPEIPASVDELVLGCLAKAPGGRPKSAAELAARLDALGVGEWTREDAHRWWERHGSTTSAKERSGGRVPTPDEAARTVAVDLEHRDARRAS